MDRRSFLNSMLSVMCCPLRAASATQLNFVFILADDLGWADTSPYGADLHETPNLERLAGSGVKFTRAYAAAPVCTPTRASIQSGKHPARLHMTIWRESARRPEMKRRMIPPQTEEDLPHSIVTLGEVFHQAGYFTAHVGKWHLGDAGHYPETQGYDVNIGGTLWGAPQTFFSPYSGDKLYGNEYRYVPGLHGGKPGEYLTDRLTTEAIKALELAGGRPFFLNLCYHTVHTPIEGKPALVEKYRRKLKPDLHHQNAEYAAMVQSLDENLGRVLDELERRGVADRTVVVFTSDNGGFVNQWQGRPVTNNAPLRSGKGSLYEGGIRVPLLIRWPGVTKPGGVCAEPVCSIDFYQTLLDAAGLSGDPQHNAGVDGISLTPLLRNPSARLERERLFFHYPHYYPTTSPVSAVLERNWKLLEYFEDGRLELYDIGKDEGERRNLAQEHPGKAAELLGHLRRWRLEVKAQMPAKNPAYKSGD